MKLRALLAAAISWLAAMLGSVAYLASNHWFGAGDLYAMAIWSLPLSVLVLVGAFCILRGTRGRGWGWGWQYVAGVLLGPLTGFGTFLIAVAMMGPWVGAFSFPVLFCWIFGGLVGFLVVAWTGRRQSWPIASGVLLIVCLALIGVSAYARAPEPRVRLHFVAGTTSEQVQFVWEHVTGCRALLAKGLTYSRPFLVQVFLIMTMIVRC